MRTKAIAADAVRWRQETLSLAEDARRNDLQRALRAGMQRIAGDSGSQACLVRWDVQAAGALDASLRNDQLNAELVDWLRTEFGRAEPPIWTVAMEVASAEALPEDLYEEDTILGDFLRAVRDHQERKDLQLDLLDVSA